MNFRNLINIVNPSYHEDHLISFTYSFEPIEEKINYNSRISGSLLTLGNNLDHLMSTTMPEFDMMGVPSVVSFLITRNKKLINKSASPKISFDNINSFVELLTDERIRFNVLIEQQDYYDFDCEISKLNKRIENI